MTRFGLVGYGFGGRYFHAPLLADADGVDFLGVVTTSPERGELARRETGRPTFASLADLAAADADAVAISTPADTHIALVEQALRLGLAVVCDKPFALDAASARGAVELAEQLGVPLTVYQNRRWDSDFRTVRRLIDDGTLGEVLTFESRFERFSPDPGPPASGGGTLRDFGAHLVDQALVLFGPVDTVYAELHTNSAGLDDHAFVALQHASGMRSQLWGSWRQGAPTSRFRVTGTRASFVIDNGMDVQEELLIGGASPASLGDRWGVEPDDRWGFVSSGGAREPVRPERGRWDEYYPAVAAALASGSALPVDPWDAVTTTAVLDAARASAASGHSVSASGAP